MAKAKRSKAQRSGPNNPHLLLQARRGGLDVNVVAHGRTALAALVAIIVVIVLGVLIRR